MTRIARLLAVAGLTAGTLSGLAGTAQAYDRCLLMPWTCYVCVTEPCYPPGPIIVCVTEPCPGVGVSAE